MKILSIKNAERYKRRRELEDKKRSKSMECAEKASDRFKQRNAEGAGKQNVGHTSEVLYMFNS